jgi:dihydrofolate reductase
VQPEREAGAQGPQGPGATLILVAALDEDGVIGRQGQLPWRLPNDLKRFRALTWGHRLLMGRKTYESLGKPLAGRDNWVVSADPAFQAPGCRLFPSVERALAAAQDAPLMVIGGATIYRQTIALAQRLELTRVHAHVGGDTFFPAVSSGQWRELGREEHVTDASHPYPYSFISLQRRTMEAGGPAVSDV